MRTKLVLAIWCTAASAATPAAGKLSAVELRSLKDGRLADSGDRIPDDAVQVYVYEGEPVSVRVTPRHIAVSYGDDQFDGHSGVLFDRATGTPARRYAVADGWPRQRPDEFATSGGSSPRGSRASRRSRSGSTRGNAGRCRFR
jgi:hypothetical protein